MFLRFLLVGRQFIVIIPMHNPGLRMDDDFTLPTLIFLLLVGIWNMPLSVVASPGGDFVLGHIQTRQRPLGSGIIAISITNSI